MEMKETILKTFAEVFGDAEGTKAYFAHRYLWCGKKEKRQ